MTVTVELRGLEIRGFHGVLPEERRDGQRFVFDLTLEVPDEAATSDRIEDAVDYRDVVATVLEVSQSHRYALLEALATAVADALEARFPLSGLRVRVRKPEVELAVPSEWAAVTVEREP
jgi:dihydroneopterin aldolase